MNNENGTAEKVLALQDRTHKMKESAQQLVIDSLKSCISDYAIRTKQAEELTSVLLTEKLTHEEFISILNTTIAQHITDKANERAVHQQQILQTTSLAVNNLRNMLHSNEIDQNTIVGIRGVVNVISQGLANALGNMTEFDKPRSSTSTNQPE